MRTKRSIRLLAALTAFALVGAACSDSDDGDTTTTTEGSDTTEAAVAFAAPTDGATVASRFDVAMAATAFTIEAAGEVNDGAGHFHVMIDTECVTPGETIPSDDQHRHFGKAQTATQLLLEEGEHTLCLQVADGEHTALDLTDEITVTVDGTLPYVTLGVPEGDTVTSPVAITMEAANFTVEAAGEVTEGAGHMHVMIDADCVTPGEVIPNDDQHRHFGDGSTEAELELEPGEHTLCLQAADGEHVALAVTHVVTITVA